LDNSHTSGVAQQNVRMIEAATRSIDRSSTMFTRRCQGMALGFSIFHFFFHLYRHRHQATDFYPKIARARGKMDRP
jgi:hypothetical protein